MLNAPFDQEILLDSNNHSVPKTCPPNYTQPICDINCNTNSDVAFNQKFFSFFNANGIIREALGYCCVAVVRIFTGIKFVNTYNGGLIIGNIEDGNTVIFIINTLDDVRIAFTMKWNSSEQLCSMCSFTGEPGISPIYGISGIPNTFCLNFIDHLLCFDESIMMDIMYDVSQL